MKLLRIIGTLLIVLVMSACSGKEEYKPVDIKLEKDLTIGGSEEDINQDFKFILSANVDEQGNIYILDPNLSVVRKFDKNGQFLWELSQKGQGPGEFMRVVGLAVGQEGKVFIVDQNNRKIMIFSSAGHFVDEFKVIDGYPIKIAVDSRDFIYVNFLWRLKDFLIHKYSPRGEKITAFMEPRFGEEKDTFLRSTKNTIYFCLDQQDNIYVSYKFDYKLFKFSPTGKLLKTWTREFLGKPVELKVIRDSNSISVEGDLITQGIEADKHNNIYVLWGWMASEKGLLIDIFSPEGQYLGNFYSGVKPIENWQYFQIDKKDNLYIIEPLKEPKLYRFKMLKSEK